MTMPPAVRRFTLIIHVTASVGWIGALAVFFAHAVASVSSQNDERTLHALSLAMSLTAWFVILPLSLASLISGIVQALGTTWGLFRNYWVLFKLVLTVVATGVLLLKLGPISYLADVGAQATSSAADLAGLRTSLLAHALGGLFVLLAAVTLAVYKPKGLTRYGIRKLREQGKDAGPGVGSTPLWVKVFGGGVILLALMLGLMILGGGHGPGAHMAADVHSGDDQASQTRRGMISG